MMWLFWMTKKPYRFFTLSKEKPAGFLPYPKKNPMVFLPYPKKPICVFFRCHLVYIILNLTLITDHSSLSWKGVLVSLQQIWFMKWFACRRLIQSTLLFHFVRSRIAPFSPSARIRVYQSWLKLKYFNIASAVLGCCFWFLSIKQRTISDCISYCFV